MNKRMKIIHIGLGPLGIKMFQYARKRPNINIVGAVDVDEKLSGKDIGVLAGEKPFNINVKTSINEAISDKEIDLAVFTTVSSINKLAKQIKPIIKAGINVISTCEELSFPFKKSNKISKELDSLARQYNVSILGTGINPGFLMDSLPTFLSSVNQNVEHIQVNRFQDASKRREPFQKKIGASLSREEFNHKVNAGDLRHVGIEESIQFIASRIGWELDRIEETIDPVMDRSGDKAKGVHQVGQGFIGDNERIRLVFRAAIQEPQSFDEIIIKGEPSFTSRVEGGINGDIATCAVTLNAIRSVIEAPPGLQTMATIPMVSYNV